MNVEIHYLTKLNFAHIIHENPYISQIHHLNEDINITIDKLKKEKFDIVIDLHKNLRSIRISKSLGCKTLQFKKLNIKKWMAVNLKVNQLPENKHLVDRYFDALQTLGIQDDGQGLDYFILPEDEYDAQGLTNGIKYQVLVLGATYFTKRIPKEKCLDIISNSQDHTILLGGNDVSELASNLSDIFPEKVINFCGKVGLGVSAGIVKHASNVVTGDTGLMHIAAALQKNITILWGNTIPAFGMYAFYGNKNKDKSVNLQVDGLSCRPCSKLGFGHCPKKHFKCMMDIDVLSI